MTRSSRQPIRKGPKDWTQYTQPPLTSDMKVRTSPRKKIQQREWWKIEVKPHIYTPPPEDQTPPPLPATTEIVEAEKWAEHPVLKVQVSTYGRVQLARGSKSFGSPNQRGYMRVSLRDPKTKKPTKYAVHRLVAEAHADPLTYRIMQTNGYVVNHIDNNPSNNWLINLEWTSGKGNAEHYWTEVYPIKQRERTIMDILKNKASRPIYIADEHGRIRCARRRVNVYNSVDKAWLEGLGLWEDIASLLGNQLSRVE